MPESSPTSNPVTSPFPSTPTAAGVRAAEAKAEKAEERKDAAAEKKAAKNLLPAGSSGDPDVQRLLAIREGHMLSLLPDPDLAGQRKAAQKAVDEVDKELAALGYTAE